MIQDAWMWFWGPEFGAVIAILGMFAVILVAGFAGAMVVESSSRR